ncbi:polysaccharide deacetylase family protein [Brucella pseudogrignonensis]|uniref:polysaccharide deacetylase family protein n=1 Tax=Brucella pseudogrignonensis TaxID=419475 RepID=UPI000DE34374|nr:polysaccharide deacetylase family protein [Brucella pseudogrignonensis]KAB2691167.1 polysaccharide deacetylase family protein [Brucella pseudogrignonensis]
MFRQLLAAGAALVCLSSVASAYDALPQPEKHEKISIVEPQLRIAKGGPASPQVALTLDACMGKTDHRILDVLVENRIPATIFVTARWLKQNAEAFAVMKAHPDLFDIENHGNMHVPAITNAPTMYNIKTAGSLDAVRSEIDGGADAIAKSGASKPQWYRDATARYSTDAIKLAQSMGYEIGGYSLNGDQGASLLAPVVARRISAARDGDVIISHINQPTRSAGEGVAKGILALQAKGMKFVKLRDVQTTMTLNPVPAHNLHAIAPAAAIKPQAEK